VLHAQFSKVVQANPRLTDQLVMDKGGGGTLLQHPASCSEDQINVMFSSVPHRERCERKLYTPCHLHRDVRGQQKFIVESGYTLLNKDKPVILLTFAESKAGEFALVLSMSHAVGDGRTLYEVLEMLTPGTDMCGLPTALVPAFHDAMLDRCNRKALAWVDGASALCHMLPILPGCGTKPK